MTTDTTSSHPDAVCRPVHREEGWCGFEFPTLSGAFARMLLHPDGSVMFETEDTVHCLAIDLKANWHSYVKLEVVRSRRPWCPETPDEDLTVEAVNLSWCDMVVVYNITRDTAEEIVALLRHELLSRQQSRHKNGVTEAILAPVALALAAAVIGLTSGFAAGMVLTHA